MDEKLILFLDELSSSLKNKTLTTDQIKLIGEFYMLYNCDNHIDSEDNDLKKYLATGWYIHNIIYPALEDSANT